jgi:hypothetical protein
LPSTLSYKLVGSLRASLEVATKKCQVKALLEYSIRDTLTLDLLGNILNNNMLILSSRKEKDKTKNLQTIETLKILLKEERFKV